MSKVMEVKNLKVHYPIRGGFFNRILDYVYAVDGVDMLIESGKSYGLVGESGSGKSTIGKAIIGLEKVTSGEVIYNEKRISLNKIKRKSTYRKDVQMIFQDSMSSLNPKKRVLDIIAEPLRNFDNLTVKEEKKKVIELLNIVGMTEDTIYKYPFEFSGGQRQRIGVARSVATKPKLIIADEPVSALDLSVQAQVLNYMKDIQKQFGLSYIFISHDLGVVKHMCDEIYIMYRGRFVEKGLREDIYTNPQHIYTKRLIAAIPDVNPRTRDINRENRLLVEKEYKEKEKEYYTENGKVFDLKPLNPTKSNETHFVALKGVK
ncbi:ATP-binding cassette domain-containing protein [Sneathia sanguinegens]|uniref:ATP-binding cassette domain-containing protein n=1 Tax=Sneathia sanguinegens TaxID=40543 RepID=UPI0023F78612|nr:ATP-binding cassette domain-containing protein [Sneathia sanguinegens]